MTHADDTHVHVYASPPPTTAPPSDESAASGVDIALQAIGMTALGVGAGYLTGYLADCLAGGRPLPTWVRRRFGAPIVTVHDRADSGHGRGTGRR